MAAGEVYQWLRVMMVGSMGRLWLPLSRVSNCGGWLLPPFSLCGFLGTSGWPLCDATCFARWTFLGPIHRAPLNVVLRRSDCYHQFLLLALFSIT